MSIHLDGAIWKVDNTTMATTSTVEVKYTDPGAYCAKVYVLGCSFAETPLRNVKRALKASGPANGIDVAKLHAGSVNALVGR
jgi:hypothetical protein